MNTRISDRVAGLACVVLGMVGLAVQRGWPLDLSASCIALLGVLLIVFGGT